MPNPGKHPHEHIVKLVRQKRGPNEGIFRDVLTLVVGAGIKTTQHLLNIFSPLFIWHKENSNKILFQGTHEFCKLSLQLHMQIYTEPRMLCAKLIK